MFKACIFVVVALLLFATAAQAATGDYVILLHGIGRSNGSMKKMADNLTSHGYQVLNIDYKTRDNGICPLAEEIKPQIEAFTTDKTKKINFVGHSLGGLVTRCYIHKHRPENLGRVVMLGTPNHGSPDADLLKNRSLYLDVFGPAGQELTTKQDFDKRFGVVDYDVGVIAGDRSLDPASSLVIKGPDDGKVPVNSTRLTGMKDWILLHTTHTLIMKNKTVIAQTRYFIENGKFDRAK